MDYPLDNGVDDGADNGVDDGADHGDGSFLARTAKYLKKEMFFFDKENTVDVISARTSLKWTREEIWNGVKK